MIYLKKKEQSAIDFVSKFIHGNWLEQNDGNFKYQNIGYDNIKNPAKEFKEFFILEQNNQCCYCSRKIENSKTTELEHIIPYSKSEIHEFKEYYKYSKTLEENVVPQKLFEASKTKLDTPPYPHHIAYHNIIASCDGITFKGGENFTCGNRERRDKFIPPFNLMPNSIGYLPDGTIFNLHDETNRSHFSTLNLDKPILMKIRRLWYLFSKSNLTLDQVLNDHFTTDILEKIVAYAVANSVTPEIDIYLTREFSVQNTWDIFKDYSFFYDYYKKNH